MGDVKRNAKLSERLRLMTDDEVEEHLLSVGLIKTHEVGTYKNRIDAMKKDYTRAMQLLMQKQWRVKR